MGENQDDLYVESTRISGVEPVIATQKLFILDITAKPTFAPRQLACQRLGKQIT